MAKAKTQDEMMAACVAAALKLAEMRRWSDVSLAQISEEAGLSLEQLHGHIDKDLIAKAVEPSFDKAMSEGSFDVEETPRTRLFDVIMMRFEAMDASRDGMMSFLRWRDRSLTGLALRAQSRLKTVKWALSCAGLDANDDLPRAVRMTSLAWAIAQAERAWRTEMSSDLSKTMAALDAALLKSEERATWFQKQTQHSDSPAEPQTEAPT